MSSIRPREHRPEGFEREFDRLVSDEPETFDRICRGLPSAKEYLEAHLDEYAWFPNMLARAKEYVPARLPRPVPYFTKPWWCFGNSFERAKETGLRYVEGIAVSPCGIMPHAWNSTDGTDVLDYTWAYQHVNKYYGVELDPSWMEQNDIPWGFTGYLYNSRRPLATPRATKAHLEKWSRIFDAEFK